MLTSLNSFCTVHFRRAAWLIFVFLLLLMFQGTAGIIHGQSIDTYWSRPENLSRSGATDFSQMVVDANGTIHVIWQDAFDGYKYVSGDGQNWLPAQTVDLPFGSRLLQEQDGSSPLYAPQLVPDNAGNIHAIWIDGQGSLQYSRVSGLFFADFGSWLPAQQLAESAQVADITIDEGGRVDLLYLRPLSSGLFPSGVYYRRSVNRGLDWSSPILIYESPYYRSRSAEQLSVDVTASNQNTVFLSWDNRAIEYVYMARSIDGGATWNAIEEVDRKLPEDGFAATGPRRLWTISSGDIVQRIWQAGHGGSICNQYYELSFDGGDNWQSRRPMFGTPQCPEKQQMLMAPDRMPLLLLENDEGMLYSIWNGTYWSEPELLAGLNSLIDPELFRQVQLGCRQGALKQPSGENVEARLIVVGCDMGEGEDIWSLSMPYEVLRDSAFPETDTIWKVVETIATSDTMFESPKLIADQDGFLHLIWGQSDPGDLSQKVLYYSRWDGQAWAEPVSVQSVPDQGPTAQINATIDHTGRMMIVWSSGQPGDIYFSRSESGRSLSPANWTEPESVPLPRPAGLSPAIARDDLGTTYIAYAIPLNEDRGIYLAVSPDGGDSWSGPYQVFDGSMAGWEMVGAPVISADRDGTLQIMWQQLSSPPNGRSLGLYAVRSLDGGISWSEVETLVQSEVSWSQLLLTDDRGVHRFWGESDGSIWHQNSTDSGASWKAPVRIAINDDHSSVVGVARDGTGRPIVSLAGIAGKGEGNVSSAAYTTLKHWIWSGEAWLSEPAVRLDIGAVADLTTAVAAGSSLSVVYSGESLNFQPGEAGNLLQFTQKRLNLPEVLPAPLPTFTPTPVQPEAITASREPTPTSTVAFPTDMGSSGQLPLQIDPANPLTGWIAGAIPAGLLVLVVFFIGVRMVRRDRN